MSVYNKALFKFQQIPPVRVVNTKDLLKHTHMAALYTLLCFNYKGLMVLLL